MIKLQQVFSRVVTLILFVASFLFFAVAYYGHIHYNEDFQLFLFSSDYILDLIRFPGGIAAVISRFLIQFFIYAPLGGLIYALLITLAYSLFRLLFKESSLLTDSLALIPTLILWVVLCEEYAQITLAVCIVIPLSAALFCSHSKRPSLYFLLLTPVIYWTCGLAAIIFSFAALSLRKWWVPVCSLIMVCTLPFVIKWIANMDVLTLYHGFYYWKDTWTGSQWPLIVFSIAALFAALSAFKLKGNEKAAYGILSVSVIAFAITLIKFPDYKYEEELQYSHLVREQKWDQIIDKAERKQPFDYFSLSDLNLALAIKGRLGEDMFKYPQSGTIGLIPEYEKFHDTNLIISDIYYYLALPSPSQRHMFECKEAIPSMEKSARAYQRLAQTNSINYQFAASRKYLDALSKTLFYRKWASDFNDFSEEIVKYREQRHQNVDFHFSRESIIAQLLLLYQQNPSNEMAFQYAAAYAMLEKDMVLLNKILALKSFDRVPKSYQEACLIIWKSNHKDFTGVPGFIDPSTVERFRTFAQAAGNKLAPILIKEQMGDTYWYYYYFVSQNTN